MLAGFLKGEPVELVRGKTVDLEVPANAEIVLEGYVEQGDLAPEGPFGDHTGYYTGVEPFPVFHVTAMTMRKRRDLSVDRRRASRRRRTPGWGRRPSGSSCPRSR